MKLFRVKITSSNFTESQKLKITEAAQIVEECFNSEYFKIAVLKKETNHQLKFHYTDDTNEQVYNKIMSGAEVLDQEEDNEADIFLELDNGFTWSAIGYTYPNTKWQWVYNRFFKRMTAAGLAGNIAHEWMHKIGYDHEFNWTPLREHSVPYWVGYFVEEYASFREGQSYFKRFKRYFA